jgi:hypothetical protein
MRRLGRQSDEIEPVGLAIDFDLQLPVRGAERELDVAGNDWPVVVATELVGAWLARHGVQVGLQFDHYVTGGARQCRACGEANLKNEKRIGDFGLSQGVAVMTA